MASEMGVNLQSEFGAFCDYHEAKGSTFKSWDAALRTWIRNAAKFSGNPNRATQGKNPTTPARATADNFSARNYGVTDAPGWMEE